MAEGSQSGSSSSRGSCSGASPPRAISCIAFSSSKSSVYSRNRGRCRSAFVRTSLWRPSSGASGGNRWVISAAT